jgi:hypothetical protein
MPVNHVLLETIELSQSAASVTFDNIPQTGYSGLKIVMSARSTATFGNNFYDTYLTINGTNVTWRDILGQGSGTVTSRNDTTSFPTLGVTSSQATASTFGNVEIYIPNYNSTSTNKSISMDSVSESNGTQAAAQLSAGLYASNTAITSITITPYNSPTGSFVQYSTFSLYGIAATGTTPVTAPKAQGGNIVANDGTYWYHAFLASGTFIPLTSLSCDYLVVAGGGGGGYGHGGGGGGGGLRSTVTATGGGGSIETALALSATSYTVTVGAGGASGATTSLRASNGSNSTFSTVTSTGGGGGGSRLTEITGAAGGSGGGGSLGGTGGAGTTNQGYAGGGSVSTNPGSGGGGAGGIGATAITVAGVGANGGAGVTISAFATPTSTGVSSAYAGGGGGGANGGGGSSTSNGSATGGGGGGGTTVGTAGTSNTGGGGGGGAFANNTQQVGAAGGSGIVIIRYAMA